jgi:hypothetical protein
MHTPDSINNAPVTVRVTRRTLLQSAAVALSAVPAGLLAQVCADATVVGRERALALKRHYNITQEHTRGYRLGVFARAAYVKGVGLKDEIGLLAASARSAPDERWVSVPAHWSDDQKLEAYTRLGSICLYELECPGFHAEDAHGASKLDATWARRQAYAKSFLKEWLA